MADIQALEDQLKIMQATISAAATKMAVDEANMSHLKEKVDKLEQELSVAKSEVSKIQRDIVRGRTAAVVIVGMGSFITALITKWESVASFFSR